MLSDNNERSWCPARRPASKNVATVAGLTVLFTVVPTVIAPACLAAGPTMCAVLAAALFAAAAVGR